MSEISEWEYLVAQLKAENRALAEKYEVVQRSRIVLNEERDELEAKVTALEEALKLYLKHYEDGGENELLWDVIAEKAQHALQSTPRQTGQVGTTDVFIDKPQLPEDQP
jgi:hypothetical protein